MEVLPAPAQKPGPQYLVLHLLYVQVPSVEKALEHPFIHKREGEFLDDTAAAPARVPSQRLAELVEKGECYAFFGQRLEERGELDPNWPAVHPQAARKMQLRRRCWNTVRHTPTPLDAE